MKRRAGSMSSNDQITSNDSRDNPDRLLTVVQAAEVLRLSPGNLYRLRESVPAIKFSYRCTCFSRAALLLWIDGLTLRPSQPDPLLSCAVIRTLRLLLY
jgi:hypothetical protein